MPRRRHALMILPVLWLLIFGMLAAPVQGKVGDGLLTQSATSRATDATEVEDLISHMSLDEKLSQMIIPSISAWEGTDVVDLEKLDDLKAALCAHQYGGIILYSSNVEDTAQVVKLVNQLQENNKGAAGDTYVPYFMCADEEGGSVVRFTMGTRMTGSMALSATGQRAEDYTFTTGQILGSECAALGLNVDFAPSMDVNSNPANPVIGTRSFSDLPERVSTLGERFVAGLRSEKVIATLKHFPGHGDTDTDTHIGSATVNKTIEELRASDLVPFQQWIEADSVGMIMTAHITLPRYDDEVKFADGTMGHYPATMSKKIITTLLRGEMGYDGVVITDALNMDALYASRLVPGTVDSATKDPTKRADATYRANLAEKIINSGCDILLMPLDLRSQEAADLYERYLDILKDKVERGDISIDRINQSVRRILTLKQSYGLLSSYTPADPTKAAETVGSAAHHAKEREIARKAITLVKNDDLTLPLSGHSGSVVLLGRLDTDQNALSYAVGELQEKGLVRRDALVINLALGTTAGDPDSPMRITIDYYMDSTTGEPHYTDDLEKALRAADTVLCLTANRGPEALAESSPYHRCVARALATTHASGGRFVLLANNLPYDAARYQDSDAILLSYLSAGAAADPTEITDGSVAFNANMICGVEAAFDEVGPTGTLPVMIPIITLTDTGEVTYTTKPLYERGYGLTYDYAFVKDSDSTFLRGSSQDLSFQSNARLDKLLAIEVDGKELAPAHYRVATDDGTITLRGEHLDTLKTGAHTLVATLDYGTRSVSCETTFQVTSDAAANASPVRRITGSTQLDVMAATIDEGFETSPWAVVTSDANPADAVVATALAGVHACPTILTDPSRLSGQAASALIRLGVDNVLIVGGTASVSTTVEEAIQDLVITCTRSGGRNRYQTSIAALQSLREAGSGSDTVIVTTGATFADALSMGPYAYAMGSAIVLTKPDGTLSKDLVEALVADEYLRHVILVGGTTAVSDTVREQLGAAFDFERIGGSNRYATSAEAATYVISHGLGWEHPLVTTGKGLTDTLPGAALAGIHRSPLLLSDSADAPTITLLRKNASKIRDVRVLCTDSITSAEVDEIMSDAAAKL